MISSKYTLGLALGIGLVALIAVPASAATSTVPDHKVGICHATGSTTNPYVFIVVDKHAAAAHAKHQDGRDVIGVTSAAACPKPAAVKVSPTPVPGKGSVLGTSTAPTTLPVTGGDLSALIGTPAMLLAARAYLRSRRSK